MNPASVKLDAATVCALLLQAIAPLEKVDSHPVATDLHTLSSEPQPVSMKSHSWQKRRESTKAPTRGDTCLLGSEK